MLVDWNRVRARADDDHRLHDSLILWVAGWTFVVPFAAFSYQSSLCLTFVLMFPSSTGCLSESLAVGLSEGTQGGRQTVVCNTIYGEGVSVADGFVH